MVLVAWAEPVENGWAQIPITVAKDYIASTTIPSGPGPFAWAKQENFVSMLEDAGWHDVRVDAFEGLAEIRIGESDDPVQRAVDFAMRIGPMASRIKDIDAPSREKLRGELYAAFERYSDKNSVKVPTKAWIIQGRA
jgi:hypothetical protein